MAYAVLRVRGLRTSFPGPLGPIAAVDGVDLDLAATLRDWVHRYNAEGIGGLVDRLASGREPRLTPEQDEEPKARQRNTRVSIGY